MLFRVRLGRTLSNEQPVPCKSRITRLLDKRQLLSKALPCSQVIDAPQFEFRNVAWRGRWEKKFRIARRRADRLRVVAEAECGGVEVERRAPSIVGFPIAASTARSRRDGASVLSTAFIPATYIAE